MTTITTLVNNSAPDNLRSEHGLSFWIEFGGKHVLFDTGQTDIIQKNAESLGVNLANADAVILSHGHYDHTGGMPSVFAAARKATLYLHPEAMELKFSRKAGKTRMIGMSESTRKAVQGLESKEKVVWTEQPIEIFPGFFATGPIPRKTSFEDTGGDFFVDDNCLKTDELPDDQAVYLETGKGLVVLLGCAHAGVVNTLDYIVRLTGEKRIYAVIGGMHLLHVSAKRVEYTIEALKRYNVQEIGLAHCTGDNAMQQLKEAFLGQSFECSVGTQKKILKLL